MHPRGLEPLWGLPDLWGQDYPQGLPDLLHPWGRLDLVGLSDLWGPCHHRGRGVPVPLSDLWLLEPLSDLSDLSDLFALL